MIQVILLVILTSSFLALGENKTLGWDCYLTQTNLSCPDLRNAFDSLEGYSEASSVEVDASSHLENTD